MRRMQSWPEHTVLTFAACAGAGTRVESHVAAVPARRKRRCCSKVELSWRLLAWILSVSSATVCACIKFHNENTRGFRWKVARILPFGRRAICMLYGICQISRSDQVLAQLLSPAH